jgi:hypothetical protein
MTTAFARTGPWPVVRILTPQARAALCQPPAVTALSLAIVGWGLLFLGASGPTALQLCFAQSTQTAAAFSTHLALAWTVFDPLRAALDWVAMVAAMMGLLLIAPLTHIRTRSLTHHRAGASTMFLLGYGMIWLLTGLIAVPALLLTGAVLNTVNIAGAGAALGLTLAALWQISPAKTIAARRCHWRPPLRITAPYVSNFAYGLSYGRRCATSCAPLMVPPMLGGHAPLTLAMILLILLHERSLLRPAFTGTALLLVCLIPF